MHYNKSEYLRQVNLFDAKWRFRRLFRDTLFLWKAESIFCIINFFFTKYCVLKLIHISTFFLPTLSTGCVYYVDNLKLFPGQFLFARYLLAFFDVERCPLLCSPSVDKRSFQQYFHLNSRILWKSPKFAPGIFLL